MPALGMGAILAAPALLLPEHGSWQPPILVGTRYDRQKYIVIKIPALCVLVSRRTDYFDHSREWPDDAKKCSLGRTGLDGIDPLA
jgi:hypothetical protein